VHGAPQEVRPPGLTDDFGEPLVLDAATYCQGLLIDPGSPAGRLFPWAAEKCCREHLEVWLRLLPSEPVSQISFDLLALFPGDHSQSFTVPRCGDGIRDCSEECDDGNTVRFDGCDESCRSERNYCGSPVRRDSLNVAASDALHVLRSSVASAACSACLCDVDGSGAVAASDALQVLLAAVGSASELACPRCVNLYNDSEYWNPNWRDEEDGCPDVHSCPIELEPAAEAECDGSCVALRECRVCDQAWLPDHCPLTD
jgi:cysteine-rich repeat protein